MVRYRTSRSYKGSNDFMEISKDIIGSSIYLTLDTINVGKGNHTGDKVAFALD